MDIKNQSGEVDFTAEFVGVRGPDGKTWKIDEFVVGCIISEGIDTPGIRCTLTFDDSADFISKINGGEILKVTLKTVQKKQVYNFQVYKISDRVRSEKRNIYNIHAVSEEFVRNEMLNMFGIYKKKKAHEYVCEIMYKDPDGIKTGKKVYAEETDEKFTWVAPNWRPFNAINFLAEKSIRKKKTGAKRQSGYIFYENVLGFHYVSLDQIIVDAKAQKPKKFIPGSQCGNRPIPPLYTYTYGQKNIADNDPREHDYLVEKISFPKSYNMIENIRHGSWAGYTQAFDPVALIKSNTNEKKSKDKPYRNEEYDIISWWNYMEHLEKEKPYDVKRVEFYLKTPRRRKLKPLGSQQFGSATEKPIPAGGANFKDVVDAVSYNYLRFRSFMYQQITIQIPGNMDLYAGYRIVLKMPKSNPDVGSERIPQDQRWSGSWIIGGLTHNYRNGNLNTNLVLVRDSTIK